MKKRKNKTKKQNLAIISLTACEGCQAVILNLGQDFLNLLQTDYNLVEMPLIEDKPDKHEYDIVIVEGSPVTKQDIKRLKTARKKSKKLIALGACACLGGIPEIKNYTSKKKAIEYVYKNTRGIENPEIRPLDEIVKVDFKIPGCPPNEQEILSTLRQLANNIMPEIIAQPVCQQCPRQATPECFLAKNEICLGPMTLAGCGAICPQNNYRCEACRGPLPGKEKQIKKFLQAFDKKMSPKKLNDLLEKFGIKDDIK